MIVLLSFSVFDGSSVFDVFLFTLCPLSSCSEELKVELLDLDGHLMEGVLSNLSFDAFSFVVGTKATLLVSNSFLDS